MEKAKRITGNRKESGLRVCTPKIIDSMMLLQTFRRKDLTDALPEIACRRVNDVLGVLRGAGFIEKGPLKRYYTYVGIQGVRRLFESFKLSGQVMPSFKTQESRKLGLYCSGRLVQLFAFKDSWNVQELRKQLCGDTSNRCYYDIISVFLGAGLVQKTLNKMIGQTILVTYPSVIYTISDEDAVDILPELKDHLNIHKSVMIFL